MKTILFTLVSIKLAAAAVPHLKSCSLNHDDGFVFFKGCMSGYLHVVNDPVSHLKEAEQYCKSDAARKN